jgi:hypothetical protein
MPAQFLETTSDENPDHRDQLQWRATHQGASAMTTAKTTCSALIVAMHGIWDKGKWFGALRPEQVPTLEEHLHSAVAYAKQYAYPVVVLSGGRTRPALPEVEAGTLTKSEALGGIDFLHDDKVDLDGVQLLAENFARDSFENLFFSLLAVRAAYSVWPVRVGLVSFDFKLLRFQCAAVGLGIADRFRFFGVGGFGGSTEYRDMISGEVRNLWQVCGSDVYDPLHRSEELRGKRARRMPSGLTEADYLGQVANAYARRGDNERTRVGELLRQLDRLKPGPGWRDIQWPWCDAMPPVD